MTRTAQTIAVLALLLMPALPARGQQLRGVVRDAATSQPIAAAEVRVLDETGQLRAQTISDSAGRFFVAWKQSERIRVAVRRLGYRDLTSEPLRVRAGEVVHTTLTLAIDALPLDAVVIDTRDRANDMAGRLEQIERRRRLGQGTFISREKIVASGASEVAQLLRNVAGISLGQGTQPQAFSDLGALVSGTGPPRSARRRTTLSPPDVGRCPMEIFLDGQHYRAPVAGVNVVPAQEIEAIEIFRGLRDMPAEFSGEHARCGVIAIWTRRGDG